MNMRPTSPSRLPPEARQRGMVLLFSLIALTIMLIVAVALVRSFNSSLFTAGNIGFKRDMQNQSERAVYKVLADFSSGGDLSSPTARSTNRAANNYSAWLLPTNSQGIPNALVLSNSAFNAAYAAGDLQSGDQSVKIRYVVDRLCVDPGTGIVDETNLGAANCHLANNPVPVGTSLSNLQGADRAPLCPTCSSAAPQGVVYRLSIKVSGPRNTQSFFQSTFTVPSSS